MMYDWYLGSYPNGRHAEIYIAKLKPQPEVVSFELKDFESKTLRFVDAALKLKLEVLIP